MNTRNSQCEAGFLHDYRIKKTFPNGVIEICRRCRVKKWFNNDTPNHVYLDYHLRAALPKYHLRYKKEYEKL